MPPKCIYEKIGILDGIPVAACTDSGGSQVIIGNRDCPIHMLSPDFFTHEEAVHQAHLVIEFGYSTGLTKEYYNLKNRGDGFAAFGMMMITSYQKRIERVKNNV